MQVSEDIIDEENIITNKIIKVKGYRACGNLFS